MTHSVKFEKGTIDSDGSLSITPVRALKQSSILKCPHYIMMPEHYRADESCRCDDPAHTEMAEWGYVWAGSNWAYDEEDA